MQLFSEIKFLLNKEIRLEWRQKAALNGMLLYALCIVFVCYQSFRTIDPATWNALFWIILLFISVNSIAKSFVQEKLSDQLYLYSITSAESVIISKLIYNVLLLIILSAICFTFYTLFLGNPIQNQTLFGVNLLFGIIGFSGTLTLLAAIAGKSSNGGQLIAVLGFPIIIPLLLLVTKVSKIAIFGLESTKLLNHIGSLIGIEVILITISIILFPYLWKE